VEGSGPSPIRAIRDKTASVTVKGQNVGVFSGTIVSMGRKIDKLEKPVGVDIHLGTEENKTEGFGTLGIALLAAIILVYLVMVSLYDSLRIHL
jgi:HAE1 family hydrophobic/amphiphilic exporter-1